ncbi:thioesterase-like superfamily-domain-containing protein [Aspergillus pseudotamarii]|uniref:Thioesterase-like superfamily-domain-containing protein n=1 Tax=Aspergillus pseudotamarii TaxID=132259 RepID=A0A5N6SXJ8_ASPPS|nr:thioesterase-like superfamily-domain-containing protein [Aspergillus pseudotamarii]KAE8139406.1 thioesterase-like superfamily-domain-containing protein [Aspergillus pseudotamarii]
MSLKQQIAVEPLRPGHFCSLENPTRLGSLSEYVFGGNTIAIAVNAAYQTVNHTYHLYSLCGHFIRPATTDRKLFCHVESIRDSKSFQTRQIRVSQAADDGANRLCLIAIADFHIEEPYSVVTYSIPPETESPSSTSRGKYFTPPPNASKNRDLYRNLEHFLDMRAFLDNETSTENHKQDTRFNSPPPAPPVIIKEMFRVPEPLGNEAEQMSVLAFYADKGLAYIPAIHNGYDLQQASACATLDFSLRVFVHSLNLGNWHMAEQKAIVAGNARAFSEGKIWNEDGHLVASMTQQTILRPSAGPGARL